MNKKITQRFFTVLTVALFFVGLSNAQILTDYVEGGYGGAAAAGETIDSVTVSTQHSFFAEPDPYYSPSYNATTNSGLGVNQRWSWFAAFDASGIAAGLPATTIDTNMVTVTFGATPGLDSIGVSETSILGCASDTTYLKVRVLASPTVTFSATAGGIIGANITLCEGDPILDGSSVVQATFTGISTYHLDYALEIYTLDADLTTILNYYSLNKTLLSAAPSTPGDSAVSAKTVDGDQITGISTTTYNLQLPTVDAGAMTAISESGTKKATIYKYSLLGTSGRISRKSDYLANSSAAANGWTVYDTTVETITIQVNPAPATGPIYHISNTWVN